MEKKRILIVSDGLPGHYKKTNAIAQIVQQRFPAEVVWVNVRLRIGLYRRVLRFFLNHTRRVPSPAWLRLFYRMAAHLPPSPDLIVSSGGRTSFMSAWLAAYHRCPSVFVGQIRGIDKRYFTRIVSSAFDYQADGKHIKSVPATEIDPDVAAEAASAFLKETGLPQRRRWTLVLGGDGGGYAYTKADWEQLRQTACRLAETRGIRWLVTSSRRTSPAAEQIFAGPAMQACADDVLIYNRDRRPLYNAFLGCAEAIVCTEDSGKMLTESVASGRPVLSVRPPKADTNERSWALIQRFETAGYIKRLTIRELGTESFQEFFDRYQPPPEPIMKRVREEVNEFLSTLSWAS